MKVVTNEEMRRLDDLAQTKHGIDATTLMAEAGRAIALEIERSYRPQSVCVVCGKGNNAGDGFVVARHFHELGRQVTVVTLEQPDSYSGAAKVAWERVSNSAVAIEPRHRLSAVLHKSEVVVDALLGTGIKGSVRDDYAAVIEEMNSAQTSIVSADVPSGLRELEPGEEPGAIIRAKLTVTIGLPKLVLLTYPGSTFVGNLVVSPINFPRELLKSDQWALNWASRSEVAEWLPARDPDSNKGSYGTVGIVAGTASYAGATLLVARGAYRSGCGLAAIYTSAQLNPIFKTALPEATSVIIAGAADGAWDEDSGASFASEIKKQNVLTVGPGLGTAPATRAFFASILDAWQGPLVIDADGINLLADGLLEKITGRADCILTPHPGEMARLTGKSVKEVQADRVNIIRDFATRYQLTVLLKGTGTLVARPDGQIWIVPGAEPALAKGGTGDVLTGAIASLFAQGMSMWQAAVAAATAHLEAGTLCAKRLGKRGVLASDVADAIPLALER